MSKLQGYMGACALAVLWTNAAMAQSAQFTTLASFANTNGSFPWSQLLLASDGNFYGTTQNGGDSAVCASCGTVFRLTPSGKLTALHSFTARSGNAPIAGLVQGPNGNLYGVTTSGAITSPSLPGGMGTVFEITTHGKLTILHRFAGPDGAVPGGGLMLGQDGNFYGTTQEGGDAGLGTIFRLTPSGTLTKLWNFDYGDYGAFPDSALVQTANGDFYGTSNGGLYGAGTVYKFSAKGKFSVVHTFTGDADGGVPTSGLVIGADGDLYGGTENGGKYVAYGTIYKLTTTGHFTTLHNFNVTDGDVPWGTMIQGKDGNFYGTTAYGGDTPYYGTIFKMTPAGKITTLHSFDNTDGAYVYAGLVQAPNGKFYGDTFGGGSSAACGTIGCGTIFSLKLAK